MQTTLKKAFAVLQNIRVTWPLSGLQKLKKDEEFFAPIGRDAHCNNRKRIEAEKSVADKTRFMSLGQKNTLSSTDAAKNG